jgi:predicted glycoside hydrolase/deacetylase ChbG (UPF0249 family)
MAADISATASRRFLMGSPAKKNALRAQVRIEITNQIRRVRSAFPANALLSVDSHQHLHMIPFVFSELLSLRQELGIAFIRIPDEPFFIGARDLPSMPKFAASNICKWIILHMVSGMARRRMALSGISQCRRFIGVLFTGHMSVPAVCKALAAIKKSCDHGTVEILCHPGKAAPGEEIFWKSDALRKFYFSENRDKESAVLMDRSLT